MSDLPLAVSHLTKRFGSFCAVHDVSFELRGGEILGFLGPNGAGKSTSLRLALGIMQPDEGQSRIYGAAPSLKNLHRVGFLPEERGLYKRMTARNVIAYFARLKGMKNSDALTRADELLERFNLSDFRKTRISRLSKGMAQKVQILSTLAHEPDILILDEPFSGLDPVNQSDLELLIREQHARGASILFSTHVMEHAERLCDRLVMMASGRKMFDGSMQEAFSLLAHKVRLATLPERDLAAEMRETSFEVAPLQVEEDDAQRIWWEVTLPHGATSQDVLTTVIQKGILIEGFDPDERRLRDVFVSLVSEAEQKYGAMRHG